MKTFVHDFVKLPILQQVTLPNGKRHYVTPEGNHYQSVTTLTGQVKAASIAKWRAKIGEAAADKISNRAKARGTSLHGTIENYLHNKPVNMLLEGDPLNKSMFYKIVPILDRLDNIKIIEGQMYSDDLELAGTTDCVADYYDDLSVVDFKTATRAKKKEDIDDYFMQGGAYGRMYEELFGITPKKVVIMLSVEDTPYPLVYIEPYEKCIKMLREFMRNLAKAK